MFLDYYEFITPSSRLNPRTTPAMLQSYIILLLNMELKLIDPYLPSLLISYVYLASYYTIVVVDLLMTRILSLEKPV